MPGIAGVDTRALTRHLAAGGAALGRIIQLEGEPGPVPDMADPNARHLVAEVASPEVRVLNPGARPRILAFDCGIKHNILRYLAGKGVEVTVVPYNYDVDAAPFEYDGVFVSNGPGDPAACVETIAVMRRLINAGTTPRDAIGHPEGSIEQAVAKAGRPIPVFGICLGSQLMALAAGAKTYKMKFGNRGQNVPAVDLRTQRCYITPQNHGYAVDMDTLPEGWRPLFINANDSSCEGVIHNSAPFMAVQFHPEAAGGPLDTDFLFDLFLREVRGAEREVTTVGASLITARQAMGAVRSVLVLGSGGLRIAQAGEFDYSGSQALKALREEGVRTILINPNVATVQTSASAADATYLLPVTAAVVESVLEKERPDGLLLSMGGQTALNVGLELHNSGVLQRMGVRVLGTQPGVIQLTEDRQAFADRMQELGEPVAASRSAETVQQAVEAANTIGYPVMVRSAFTLGGMGSGFAKNEAELVDLATHALAHSPQLLIDQDLRGWSELEYEVVRDAADNALTCCNMENVDPVGVHTGDSIVVAPSSTLTNTEYFKLRATALKVIRALGVVGECNIQYAMNPRNGDYVIIEVNARLSRSSALASKATGYPLAYVATKLALGHDLPSLRNAITGCTTACFEPALDYVVVKVPRWDLAKFEGVSRDIGSAMKSVGEVMAIGRCFEEALQKALRMAYPGTEGFVGSAYRGDVSDQGALDDALTRATDSRIFAIAAAFELAGYTVERVHELTRINRWFLGRLAHMSSVARAIKALPRGSDGLRSLEATAWRIAKGCGMSDPGIASLLSGVAPGEMLTDDDVRAARKAAGVLPVVKQIDTLAAEFPAKTNYLYTTYSAATTSDVLPGKPVLVLGSGSYSIGSSVEFDWCAVSCVRTARKAGLPTAVINCNPETVSTDYDESDRLYFEELTKERVLDIYEAERSPGVVVSMGGQIPNTLAMPLHRAGVHILGTSPVDIDRAEDRRKFSALCDALGVDQPSWAALTSAADVRAFVETVGFPCIVRPSYVLSGAAMRVVATEEQLQECLSAALDVSPEHPVVVSQFLDEAKEIEFDGVASNGRILNYAIAEHVENAGVHSGDATLLLPAQKLYVETVRRVKRVAAGIAAALRVTGPFNVQFLARDNRVLVIECNLRASRTMPFVSKTLNANLAAVATRAMLGLPVRPSVFSLVDIEYVACKAPMFSFTRLAGADPTLGVEMASTGEVACFGINALDAFLAALMASGFKVPEPGARVLLSLGPEKAKVECLESMQGLHKLGYELLATPGTAAYLQAHQVPCTVVSKDMGSPDESEGERAVPSPTGQPNVEPPTPSALRAIDAIRGGELALLINVPNAKDSKETTAGYSLRRAAVDCDVGLVTNAKCFIMLVSAMQRMKTQGGLPEPVSLQEFYSLAGCEPGDAQPAVHAAVPVASPLLRAMQRRASTLETLAL